MAQPSDQDQGGIDALCLACSDAACDFKPARFQRRQVGPKDVLIDMKYCGVCHSDLHTAANHMAVVGHGAKYPCTPAHELAGECIEVGAEVTKFKVGDHIGVGCGIDSCHDCEKCAAGDEHKCKSFVGTYNSKDKGSGRAETFPAGSHTIGGYSSKMVVTERFGILIPKDYPLECAGPVMCAGITMYDPLKKYGVKEGSRVGIVGLGGLGLMGVKIAAAMGCQVTAISRGTAKEEMARSAGATGYVASSDEKAVTAAASTLDLILDTIPSVHDWHPYHSMLAKGGHIVFLGLNQHTAASTLAWRESVKASFIGGVHNTQEVLDLCAKNKIMPNVEVVPVTQIAEVFTALDQSNDSGKRFVLDIAGTLTDDKLESWNVAAPTLQPNPTGMNFLAVGMEAFRMTVFMSDPK